MHETAEPETGGRVLAPAVVAGVATLVFLLLTVSATGTLPWTKGFDLAVHSWLVAHRCAAVVSFAATLTSTASSAFAVPAVFLAAIALTRGSLGARLARAALVTGVVGLGVLCRYGLCALIARPRPPEADWAVTASGQSFPSGHTSDAIMAAGMLAWLAAQRLHDRPVLRATVWIVAGTYVAAIAWTRVYLGVHWPTDVIGSIAFGTAWLCGALAVHRALPSGGRSSAKPTTAPD
ncbi:phosphatase PAP2 family protein [Amycolatopsis sp. NPDC005232]|uniref:phosphatase PAP2 family protein n=1 Tax=Amycolatopsis sp. NPDC005232 TaxID=3157027 RepID=UPI0033B5094B